MTMVLKKHKRCCPAQIDMVLQALILMSREQAT